MCSLTPGRSYLASTTAYTAVGQQAAAIRQWHQMSCKPKRSAQYQRVAQGTGYGGCRTRPQTQPPPDAVQAPPPASEAMPQSLPPRRILM